VDQTNFEKYFALLVRRQDRAEAVEHLVAGSDDDLKGLTRVAACRALALLEDEAGDLEAATGAPRLLKLPRKELFGKLVDEVTVRRDTDTARAAVKTYKLTIARLRRERDGAERKLAHVKSLFAPLKELWVDDR
jgi:hypothetical protein